MTGTNNITEVSDGCRILVVDDEEGMRRSLERILVRRGYYVLSVGDARKAMAKIEGEPFDIVLTDIQMPGMDGMELAAWIKHTHPNIDVIIMTGYASTETAVNAIRMGALDYLIKPFPHNELVVATVERAVKKRQLEIELRRMAEHLRKSKSDFAAIVERSSDGNIVVNGEGIVRFANASAADLLGKLREELVNTPFGLPLTLGEMTEVDILHGSGESRIAEMRLQETDWDGEPSLLVMLHDVTKSKELEDLQAEFIANISHDLRTPLTSIKNAVDIILTRKAGELSEDQERFLSMAERNISRLNKLIGDLLDISRIEAKKSKLTLDEIDARKSINGVLDNLKSMADSKSVSLISKVSERLPKTYADVSKIEQVLTNLIENAIKFTPSGGIVIVEAVSTEDLSGETTAGSLQISVVDSGIGISPEHLSRLFDRFYRASTFQPGTGLGLSICKSIVDSHGGKIWCKSLVSEGSTFAFALPIVCKAED